MSKRLIGKMRARECFVVGGIVEFVCYVKWTRKEEASELRCVLDGLVSAVVIPDCVEISHAKLHNCNRSELSPESEICIFQIKSSIGRSNLPFVISASSFKVTTRMELNSLVCSTLNW